MSTKFRNSSALLAHILYELNLMKTAAAVPQIKKTKKERGKEREIKERILCSEICKSVMTVLCCVGRC